MRPPGRTKTSESLALVRAQASPGRTKAVAEASMLSVFEASFDIVDFHHQSLDPILNPRPPIQGGAEVAEQLFFYQTLSRECLNLTSRLSHRSSISVEVPCHGYTPGTGNQTQRQPSAVGRLPDRCYVIANQTAGTQGARPSAAGPPRAPVRGPDGAQWLATPVRPSLPGWGIAFNPVRHGATAHPIRAPRGCPR